MQEDLELEIRCKVRNVNFFEVANFICKACRLPLSQVRVVFHFRWQKYTLKFQISLTHPGRTIAGNQSTDPLSEFTFQTNKFHCKKKWVV